MVQGGNCGCRIPELSGLKALAGSWCGGAGNAKIGRNRGTTGHCYVISSDIVKEKKEQINAVNIKRGKKIESDRKTR